MKALLLLITGLVSAVAIKANDTIPARHLVYKTVIYTSDGRQNTGYLTDINDSTVTISNTSFPFGTINLKEPTVVKFPYPDLSYIELKRKNSVGRGALYGALAGLAVGVIWGMVEGSDPEVPPDQDFLGIANALRMTASQKAVVYGVTLGTGGGLVGIVIGAVLKKKFIINGKKEKLKEMKLNVFDRVYGKSSNQ